ncbi:MAG TPA: insulinase family protein, partial [Alistipes obesi]|nr:insulinase family protein [Alistipes communis]
EAREAFARALFGPAHPYGITWPETAYDDLTRDDLLDFYARHYTARNCFVVCSGAADA